MNLTNKKTSRFIAASTHFLNMLGAIDIHAYILNGSLNIYTNQCNAFDPWNISNSLPIKIKDNSLLKDNCYDLSDIVGGGVITEITCSTKVLSIFSCNGFVQSIQKKKKEETLAYASISSFGIESGIAKNLFLQHLTKLSKEQTCVSSNFGISLGSVD